ncbi:MAG: hypothetical protein Q8920_12915 [Bacillota bacterium]|nr:hypothetical protein [Bacillota bacterium]
MLKSKIEIFLAKRALIILVILSIIDLVFIVDRWLGLAGIFCGAGFSILRFSSMASLFKKIFSVGSGKKAAHKSVLNYLLTQLIAVVLLFISINISSGMFAGMAAGILSLPAVVFINSITEGLGITHNNFE